MLSIEVLVSDNFSQNGFATAIYGMTRRSVAVVSRESRAAMLRSIAGVSTYGAAVGEENAREEAVER